MVTDSVSCISVATKSRGSPARFVSLPSNFTTLHLHVHLAPELRTATREKHLQLANEYAKMNLRQTSTQTYPYLACHTCRYIRSYA